MVVRFRLKNRCAVAGCSKRRARRQWCTLHYQRWRKYGDVQVTRRPTYKRWEEGLLCSESGCSKARFKGSFCDAHYKRMWRYGDPKLLYRATSTVGATPAKKAEYVRAYKLERGCADCGYNAHPAALDFDHRPGTSKVRDIKSGKQFGWEALLAEIEKCDVVCANCHRIRTFNRVQIREVV